MSVLTFLFFSSLIYFAYSDETPANATPVDPTPDYETNIKAFLDDISTSMDKNIIPMLNGYDADDKDYMKSVVTQGCAGFINYVMFLAEVTTVPKADNDIILKLNSPNPFPFTVPYQTPGQTADCADGATK